MNTFALSSSLFSRPVDVPRYKLILFHLAAWLFYYLSEVAIVLSVKVIPFPHPLESFLQFSVFAFLFYTHSEWLFPRFFIPKQYGAYALSLAGLALAFVGARYIVTIPILSHIIAKPVYPFFNTQTFFAASLNRGMLFYSYSFAYAYTRHALSIQKQLRVQEQQLREQERTLLEADIAFLKSQINPHFLFNALNFLYAQVYPLSEPTAKSVLLLSDIMRYALNEGGEQGKVMLDKEVQHLRNYLALNRLRFGNTLQVQLQVQGSTQFLLILPLVLITFVENCFKHGELFDPAHPVLIQVRVQQNQLTFFTSNRKRPGPVEFSTGIGLDNTRRRLQAIYPDRHQLILHDTPDTYATHLSLTL
jgi:sensor histidine kinase YesM